MQGLGGWGKDPGWSPHRDGRPLEGCEQSPGGSGCKQAPSSGCAENTLMNRGAEGRGLWTGSCSQLKDLEKGEFGTFQKWEEAQCDHKIVIRGERHERRTPGPNQTGRHLDFIGNMRKATDTRIFS